MPARPKAEIDTEEKLRAWLERPEPREPAVFQGLDLRPLPERSLGPLAGLVFIGCHLSTPLATRAAAEGAVVFPRVDGHLFDPWRTRLYTADELYAGFDPAKPGHA